MNKLFSSYPSLIASSNYLFHINRSISFGLAYRITKMSSSNIPIKMIDIGANLTDPMFRGVYNGSQKHRDDFEDMMQRSNDHGIEKMIITGGSLEDSKSALEIAKTRPNLYSTVGCHPTRCKEFIKNKEGPSNYLECLEKLARDNPVKVVAIGEIGLDYDRLHFCDADVQKKYFNLQLDLASKLKLPLFLHNRNSIDDFIMILRQNKHKFEVSGGVVHSFDGTEEDVVRILDLGLYIGLNGCSLKTEENLDTIKSIPVDRLMIETDCPWCEVRRSHAGFKHIRSALDKSKDAKDPKLAVKNRNEPMNLIQVLEIVAAVRNDDIGTLSKQIYDNTTKLFFSQ